MNDPGNSGASVDWQALATQLGTSSWTAGGWNELGGTDLARQALCDIVGDEQVRNAARRLAELIEHERAVSRAGEADE